MFVFITNMRVIFLYKKFDIIIIIFIITLFIVFLIMGVVLNHFSTYFKVAMTDKQKQNETQSGFVDKTKKTFHSFCYKAKNVNPDNIKKKVKDTGKNFEKGVKNFGNKAFNKAKKVGYDTGVTPYYEAHKDEWKKECKGFSSRFCNAFRDLRNLTGRKITVDQEPTLRALNSDKKSIEEKKVLLKTLFEVLRGREFIEGYHKDIIQFLDIISSDKKLNKLFESFLKTNAESLYKNISKVSDKKLLEKILLVSPIDTHSARDRKILKQISRHLSNIDKNLADLFTKNFRKYYLKSFHDTTSANSCSQVKDNKKNWY